MILFREAFTLINFIKKSKQKGHKVGLVPTMGALHEGHLSLINIAKKKADLIVVSIFVNPTQFNDLKDFKKYPITLNNDLLKLTETDCDVLFLPSVEEMYPNGTQNLTRYDLGHLEEVLEGFYRPGHFQGVSQAVHRLLEIVQPDELFLGQKDFQQCLIIAQMIRSLSLPVQVNIAPTKREPSGLAMSSRNMRLNEEESKKATAIHQVLQKIKQDFTTVPFDQLIESSGAFLLSNGFSKIDYIAIADAKNLQPVNLWNGSTVLVALVAAFMGDVRLIDNMVLNEADTGSVHIDKD